MPMVFPTISIHESFAYPTSMFLRNLMAMDTEEMIRALPVDRVVLIGGCDKTTPAQMMAAASADKPAIVLPVGPMLVGHFKRRGARRLHRLPAAVGRIPRRAHERATISKSPNERLVPSIGTCGVMGTASTIACMVEALGIALPGSASIPATHADRIRMAEATGKRAAEMTKGGPKPSEILTKDAFRNAIVMLQAIGGSTNGVVHLSAIAGRTKHPIALEDFDEIGRKTPVLVDLKPTGDHYMEHFHQAGGVPRLMQELKDVLALDAKHVMGGTLGDAIKTFEDVPGQTVIRSRSNPLKKEGGIAILRGNLAPRGAVIKQGAAAAKLMQHEGRAVVFDSVADMAKRIDDPDARRHRERCAGDAQCRADRRAGHAGSRLYADPEKARAEGHQGHGAHFRRAHERHGVRHHRAAYRAGSRRRRAAGAGEDRRPHPARCQRRARIDLLVDEAELKKRKEAWTAPPVPEVAQRGYARLYREHVQQADEGCDFDFLARPRPAILRSVAQQRVSKDKTAKLCDSWPHASRRVVACAYPLCALA